MKKREFWELIEKKSGSCIGIKCGECPNWNGEKCKTRIKHPEIKDYYNDSVGFQAARLDDAQAWLDRHPKIDKSCLAHQKTAHFTLRFGAPEKTSGEIVEVQKKSTFKVGSFYQYPDGRVFRCEGISGSDSFIPKGYFVGVELTARGPMEPIPFAAYTLIPEAGCTEAPATNPPVEPRTETPTTDFIPGRFYHHAESGFKVLCLGNPPEPHKSDEFFRARIFSPYGLGSTEVVLRKDVFVEAPPADPQVFVPATEFIPGNVYVSHDKTMTVLCTDGPQTDERFSGVWIGTGRYSTGYAKAFFSGPIDFEFKTKE